MRKLHDLWRAILFVVFSECITKFYYDDPVGTGWYAWIELKGYGTIGFEDYDGRYHFVF